MTKGLTVSAFLLCYSKEKTLQTQQAGVLKLWVVFLQPRCVGWASDHRAFLKPSLAAEQCVGWLMRLSVSWLCP